MLIGTKLGLEKFKLVRIQEFIFLLKFLSKVNKALESLTALDFCRVRQMTVFLGTDWNEND